MAGYERSIAHTYLSRVPMFGSCTPEQLDGLAALGATIAVTAGDDIIRQGDPGDAFFLVTSGTVQVGRDGRAVAELVAGDYFGELALFDAEPRNSTVTAASDASLITLSRENFVKALDATPALRDALLHGMARRLHELDAR